MIVTVRDRSAEPEWGHGPTVVNLKRIEIEDICPLCGGTGKVRKGRS